MRFAALCRPCLSLEKSISIGFRSGEYLGRDPEMHQTRMGNQWYFGMKAHAVENAIGRLRRFLPRKTNLNTLDDAALEACTAAYNDTPRKCFGFKTPAEVFIAQLLQFKRESTIGRSFGTSQRQPAVKDCVVALSPERVAEGGSGG